MYKPRTRRAIESASKVPTTALSRRIAPNSIWIRSRVPGVRVGVEVDIDYARKTFFTKGVVKANLHRLPLRDRVRFISCAVKRKLTG